MIISIASLGLWLGMGFLVKGNILGDLDERQPLDSTNDQQFSVQWITPANGATFNFNFDEKLNTTIEFNVSSSGGIPKLSVILGQINYTNTDASYVFITDIVDLCLQKNGIGCEGSTSFNTNDPSTLLITLAQTPEYDNIHFNGMNFFYCFELEHGGKSATCAANSYSPLFNLNSEGASSNTQTLLVTASTLVFSSTSAVLTNINYSTTTLILPASSTQMTPSEPTDTGSTASASITAGAGQTVYCPDCATVSITPTGTVTITSTPSADAVTSHSSHSSGLALGAKIGIAIGGAAFFFLLIIIAFLLVRRRRQQAANKPKTDHLMLSHSMQNNDSHDIFIAEKDFMSGPTSVEETSTPLTAGSRNSLNNYDAMSASNVGSAYTTNGAITLPAHSASNSLERNLLPPTALQELHHPNPPHPSPLAHSLSRGISTASSLTRPVSASSSLHHTNPLTHNPPSRPVSPRSINPSISRALSTASGISARSLPPPSHSHEALPGDGLFAEPYSDLPHTYGDGLAGGGSFGGTPFGGGVYGRSSPFLSVEPGMSDEEMRRLEEEERRIDAAIAEAERERERGRGR